jgi:hypothetical protein
LQGSALMPAMPPGGGFDPKGRPGGRSGAFFQCRHSCATGVRFAKYPPRVSVRSSLRDSVGICAIILIEGEGRNRRNLEQIPVDFTHSLHA